MESIIKWQTGEPKEDARCLVTTSTGEIKVFTWIASIKYWHDYGLQTFQFRYVRAWCKLSDIKPYKKEEV